MNFTDIFLWSPSELDQRLVNGLNPNTVINNFLQVHLIHVWAREGSLEHLKILHKHGAIFSKTTRHQMSVRMELEMRLKKTGDERFESCLEWLDKMKL